MSCWSSPYPLLTAQTLRHAYLCWIQPQDSVLENKFVLPLSMLKKSIHDLDFELLPIGANVSHQATNHIWRLFGSLSGAAREASPLYQTFADAVLLLHFGFVLFVVLGLPLIVIGGKAGWSWTNAFRWRLAHLLAIGVVALQAWLGRYCPLTILESWLREQAGQAAYSASFVEHWVQRVLYYEAPLWVFAVAYTVFGILVAWAWWRYPPLLRRGKPLDRAEDAKNQRRT